MIIGANYGAELAIPLGGDLDENEPFTQDEVQRVLKLIQV